MAVERALCPALVGREGELTILEDALLDAHRGEGQMVILAGEAGLGKTRLASELQKRAAGGGTIVMRGSCSEADLSLPYLPFLEAIGNYLSNADLDRLRARLGTAGHELGQLFPQLRPDGSSADGGDPSGQGKLRLFEGMISLFRDAATEHGLLLVLEDLHWADASTRELLDYMTRRLSHTRMLILATYRSDELDRKHPLLPLVQGWKRGNLVTLVDLHPLEAAGLADMVRAIFDTEEVTDDFRDFLYRRTEGNPFVLEEMLKAALDRGDIYRAAGKWERPPDLSQLKIPPTVRDTILLRVERLQREEAEILRTAAVLGLSFSYATLAAVSGKPEETVLSALQRCVQQQLVEEQPQTRERYRFRHSLTREAIYEDLIAPQRSRLHLRAAEVLRALPGTEPVDLAYHLLAAGRVEEAIPVCIKAAEDAERRRGYQEAAELYSRILPDVKDRLMNAQLMCRIGEALYLDGQASTPLAYFAEAIPTLESLGQVQEAARYRLLLGRCHWLQQRPEAAAVEYERARAALEPLGPSADLANAYIRLAGLASFDYRGEEAHALATRAVEIAEAAHADASRIWAYNFVGLGLARMGRKDEGIVYLDRSYEEAQARDLWWIAANALGNGIHTRLTAYRGREALPRAEALRREFSGDYRWFGPVMHALVLRTLGEPRKAIETGESIVELALEAGATTIAIRMARELAIAKSMAGEHEEALRLMPTAESFREYQDTVPRAYGAIRVSIDAGRPSDAIREAERGLSLLRPNQLQGEELFLADIALEAFLADADLDRSAQVMSRVSTADPMDPYVRRMNGRMALQRGELPVALEQLTASTDFFERVGYRDDEWRSRRVLADAKLRAGDRAGAEADLRRVLSEAPQHGHVTEAAAATHQLAAMGITTESPTSSGATSLLSPARGGGQGGGLQSERYVTILFLDVRGYTKMSSEQAPAEMADRIAAFYRWAEQEIERHHGQVSQHSGDAVMATFNVSGSRIDHAAHALEAAIAIRDRAAYLKLPLGAGVASGPAIVGQFSDGSSPTALGETVNLAARLQQTAAAGEVLLNDEAHRRIASSSSGSHWVADPVRLDLKGFNDAVNAFRLAAPNRS
jgi:class 3 adenylate cyclase/tetratricopeptide (TPR) repeat protein